MRVRARNVVSWIRRRRRRIVAASIVGLAALVGTAGASHLANETQGHSTFDQTIVPAEDPVDGYTDLQLGPAENEYILRDAGENPDLPAAQPGRAADRESLTYFSQLTDFQLADEESPVRVEFLDPGASSAWRPQEGFTAFQMEATIRQINEFADASPIAAGDGSFNSMDFALLTGDQADNQQLNETRWVRDLLEGTTAPIDFNSGLDDPADYAPENVPGLGASCAAFVAQEGAEAGATTPEDAAAAAAAEGGRYTGVQDYDDYPAPPVTPLYYDPDVPQGDFADWPDYDGLMDRAQQLAFTPEGLDVPFYVTNGNHDVLVQGNEDANAAFEEIATGCSKVLATTNAPQPPGPPDPNALFSPAGAAMLIPPDPDRRFVSKPQIKEVYGATDEGPGDDDHGFAHVDPAEDAASNGSASYYAWNPPQAPGLRFISIDTNSEGGQTAEGVASGSSNGNIDDPQFQWLKQELAAADEQDRLVVIFGHHPVRSMSTQIHDEQAAPCAGGDDGHGHDPDPGCDLDPRPSGDDPSTPETECLHNGTDAQNSTCSDAQHESFEELIDQSSTVLAYVPGHTHEHRLTPFIRSDGTTWWEVNTSAVVDYPNQSRLVEIMDNDDGTMSIFNTVVDHASPATAPAPGPATGFTEPMLASLGRTFSYNDPDNDQSGTGAPEDRNAELLLEDPRPDTDLSIAKTADAATVTAGEPLTYTLTATNNGGIEALETVLTDVLPPGYSASSTEPSQGSCSQAGQTVSCNLGALAGGESATVTIAGTPNQAGTISNTAAVSGNVTDPDASNDSATVTTTVLPAPAESECGGKTVTIEAGPGAGIIRGTPGNDVIAGGDGDETIIGLGGNDLICGGGGDDQLKGKGGKDKLRGGGGKDGLRGGAKDDRLKGGGGRDTLRGGTGEDRCNGGKGRDTSPENDCEKTSGI